MHVELKMNGYEPSRLDQDRLDQAIATLDRLTDTYAARRLHVTIEKFGHTEECQVRMLLALAKHRLVTVQRAPALATAAERCVDVLAGLIALAKDRVHRGHGEREIRRAKEEAGFVDLEALRRAHIDGDYDRWLTALADMDEMVEAEIGRRLKFHPDAEALLGDGLVIQDLVDSVLYYSFENYEAKPQNVPLREWIFSNIDICIDEAVKEALGGSGLAA